MESKAAIVSQFTPIAALTAMTPEATAALPQKMVVQGMVGIYGFPFRVGRESRGNIVDGKFHRIERPLPEGRAPTNDVSLVDAGELLQISREHFRIERTGTDYQVVDRGSVCGMLVGGVQIGGNETGGSAPLRDGDEIQIGTDTTPYRYTFIILEMGIPFTHVLAIYRKRWNCTVPVRQQQLVEPTGKRVVRLSPGSVPEPKESPSQPRLPAILSNYSRKFSSK